MQNVSSEYDIGIFQIEDIKTKNLSLKIKEHNTTILGNIKNFNNTSVSDLELVLYRFEANHELVRVDKVKTDELGSYKFNDVIIGTYIVKHNEFNPEVLNINQRLVSSSQSNRFPWRSSYNVANGYLQDGARLDATNDRVIFIGGPDDGSSSIYVYAVKDGQYNIEIDYIGGLRSFNIDVDNQNTGQIYKTPKEYFGTVTLTLTLTLGYNLLKFYGADSNFAPTLGVFTLTLIEPGQTNYNLTKGVLENGAKLDITKDRVIHLGGPNNGSAKIVVTVDNTGYYLLNISFKHGGRPFLVDVNNVSTGEIYIVQSTFSGKFSLQVYLTKSFNEIKFYGIDNRVAPNLGKFDLTPIDTPKQVLPPVAPIIVTPTPTPPKKDYSVAEGIITNGAILSANKDFVLYLGGYNQGTSTVTVNVQKAGTYNITIDYVNGLRPFKMSVNAKDTGKIYRTPRQFEGKFITTLDLISGDNIIAFYGVFNQHSSYLGYFTLELASVKPPAPPVQPTPPTPQPLQEERNVARGGLKDGAILSANKDFVLYLGGHNNGSSTVTVTVQKSGKHRISVDFQNGYKPLKIDVNNQPTGTVYMTPTGHSGTFTTVLDLRAGRNTIKFYGTSTQHASYLGKFTLDFVLTPLSPIYPPGTYDASSGVFENGAILDISTNFVNNLGGNNNGSTTINVNVTDTGTYKVEIKYLAADADRNLSVDVNGANSGIFTPPITSGWSLANVKTFTFQIVLNAGDNEVKFHGDGVNHAPMLGTFVVTPASNPPQLPDYTFSTLNTLNYSDLVSVIKTINWYDVPGLFDFSGDSYHFFNDDNRVQAIIDELEQSGHFFTAQNEQGIDTLVEFLRGGLYIAYNNSQLGRLDDITYRNKCIPAIKAVIGNTNFRLGTDIQDKVVQAVGKLIGNASADVEIINELATVLEQYKNNIVNYSTESQKNAAIYKIARETNYFLSREIIRMGNDPQNTNFYGRIDSFITQLEGLAEEGYRASADSEWLVNNFVDIISDLSRFRRDNRITQRVLTNCLNRYQQTSSTYLQILSEIKDRFNSQLSDGTTINYDQKITEAKNNNLPNIYRFDDGEVIIRTGSQVSVDKVRKLYWASKEVKAQFVRVALNDVALEPGNPDDTLTMVVYNSPDHYKINYQLYGYSTDNGGIYQEDIGTFFTYDREVPRDSVFSLEELFRHEFVHYLEGRFLVRGIGSQGFSRDLIWFTEGTAEFFAGATRTEGVKARESVVRNLSTNTNNQLSLNELFNARYGSFNFYKYGFAFSYTMYSMNLGQFLYIVNTLKTNNSTAYENYLQNLRSDTNTNSAYQQTIANLIRNLGSLTAPAASDDYLTRHSYMTVTQIYSDVASIIYMGNITTETKTSDYFETVSLRGTYNNGVSIDQVSDWNAINRILDRALVELENRGWSGYKTFTAYFTNYRVDTYGYALFDIVFHGILRSF